MTVSQREESKGTGFVSLLNHNAGEHKKCYQLSKIFLKTDALLFQSDLPSLYFLEVNFNRLNEIFQKNDSIDITRANSIYMQM